VIRPSLGCQSRSARVRPSSGSEASMVGFPEVQPVPVWADGEGELDSDGAGRDFGCPGHRRSHLLLVRAGLRRRGGADAEHPGLGGGLSSQRGQDVESAAWH
jgi:hypothetical protein